MYLNGKRHAKTKNNITNRMSCRIQLKRFLNIVFAKTSLKLTLLFLTLRWHGRKWLEVARVEMVCFFNHLFASDELQTSGKYNE